MIWPGLYVIEFPRPHPPKGLEMGREIKGGEKKKRKLGENLTFGSTKL